SARVRRLSVFSHSIVGGNSGAGRVPSKGTSAAGAGSASTKPSRQGIHAPRHRGQCLMPDVLILAFENSDTFSRVKGGDPGPPAEARTVAGLVGTGASGWIFPHPFAGRTALRRERRAPIVFGIGKRCPVKRDSSWWLPDSRVVRGR